MAMTFSDDFWPWYDHLLTNSTRIQEMQSFFLQNVEAFNLDKVKSMISIGPGNGQIDSFVLDQCCSNLDHYIGVEPHDPSLENLSSTLDQFPNLKVTLVKEGIPHWTGPQEPVDLVIVNHVMYYIFDRMAAIRQLYSWLKPGGALLIFHSYNDNAYTQIAKGENSTGNNRYGFLQLKKELIQEGFETFEDHKIIYRMVMSEDDEMVKLYFKYTDGDISKNNIENLVRQIRDSYDATRPYMENLDGCMRVIKPFNTNRTRVEGHNLATLPKQL